MAGAGHGLALCLARINSLTSEGMRNLLFPSRGERQETPRPIPNPREDDPGTPRGDPP